MTKRTAYTATAPNGQDYTLHLAKRPAAIRFLDIDPTAEAVDERYVITYHKTVKAAGTSFTSPSWRYLLRPDSVVTDIREG